MTRWLILVGFAAGAAAAGLLGLLVWRVSGSVEVPWQGWLAMGVGTLFTVLVGGGLMALVFFSARRGYDDRAGILPPGERPTGDPPPPEGPPR